jgi:DMSO/TMAO reductase YedYZ molybdopterin-dependent catalytic subunit
VPHVPVSEWRLEIDGLVERTASFSWEEFLRLPQSDDTSDFHCVTTWSRMDLSWKGVRFRDLMTLVVPTEEAHYVVTTAYDVDPSSGEPYTTNLSLDDAMEPDVLLVHTVDGEPLPAEHGGPCRMITPRLYAWKGAKWIRRITLVHEDRPGFWERRGYSNTAYPWYEDRYNRG